MAAHALPLIDQTILPQRTVKVIAPIHPRALARIDPPPILPRAQPPAQPVVLPVALPVAAPLYENSTAFSFWPQANAEDIDLGLDLPTKDWLSSDTLLQTAVGQALSQDEENRWRGVHVLGKGTGCRVGL
jgi:hypothetical protein